MKVLHVINSLDIGGAQTLLTDSLPRFVEKKVESEVFVLKKSSEGNFEEILKFKGINIIYSQVEQIYSPLQILELKRLIQQNSYDIVHSHTFPSQYWVSLLKNLIRKPPVFITTEHSTSNRRREKKVFKYLDKFIYRNYRHIVCISEGTLSELITWVSDVKPKSSVIENGIDLKKLTVASPLNPKDIIPNYQDGDKIIVMVARLTEQKDHKTVIQAASKLPSNMHIVFVGGGEKYSEYEAMIKQNNLESQVHLLGPRKDVPNIIKAADLFVLSSHFEGFGLVVVEAMASGIPVIGSDVTGLTDVVSGAGKLFQQGDSQELANIIIELVNHPEMCTAMIEAGYKKSSLYSIERFVDEHMKLYQSLL